MKTLITVITIIFLASFSSPDNVLTRFKIPAGYHQLNAEQGSFGAYLQGLPLKPAGTHTLTYKQLQIPKLLRLWI
jgi:hypothetical protein